jgi:hypothetical protein
LFADPASWPWLRDVFSPELYSRKASGRTSRVNEVNSIKNSNFEEIRHTCLYYEVNVNSSFTFVDMHVYIEIIYFHFLFDAPRGSTVELLTKNYEQFQVHNRLLGQIIR